MSQVINNAATQAIESGIYTSERAKQGAAGLTNDGRASSGAVKREAQVKASDVQTAASDAAETAQEKFPEAKKQTASTADVLQHDLSQKTDVAAAEGQKDVEAAKTTSASYVDQAKLYAGSVLATAQSYVEAGQNKLGPSTSPNATTENGGIGSTLQSAAGTALGTTKNLISTAQQTLQPHVDNARETAQPYAESARETVQPHVDNARQAAQPYVDSARETVQPHVEAATNAAKPYIQSARNAVDPSTEAKGKIDPACEG